MAPMKGTLLDFSVQESKGTISGDDGVRYNFIGTEWKGAQPPVLSQRVDFQFQDGSVVGVYPDFSQYANGIVPGVPARVDKTSAGICGILLGGLGIHKFIMGYSMEGAIMLVVSLVTGLFTCGLSSLIIHLIGLIEGIIYLSMTQEQFDYTYIRNRKPWF
jgi:TM2 domain-containing membrane protein YozV